MGDRGNIFFVDSREGEALGGIYMYTHWSGSVLPGIVRAALDRGRGRWGDSQYLARIVFCELVQDAVLAEIGYGLGTHIGDNEHAVVRIDDLSSRVSFHEQGKETRLGDPGLASWSYEDYLAAPSAEIERAFLGEPAAEAPRGKGTGKGKAAGKGKSNGKGKGKGKGRAPRGNGKGAPAAARARPAKRRAGAK